MRRSSLLFVCTLAACGGAGSTPGTTSGGPPSATNAPGSNAPSPGSSSNPGGQAQPTTVTFAVRFPGASASTSVRSRRPAYISPSAESLSLSIDGAAPIYVDAPATSTLPQTVTTTVPAPPGNDTFAISEYDGQNGAGNVLGEVTSVQTVIAGANNHLTVTVNGELATIAIEAAASPFVEGTVAGGVTLVGNLPQTFYAVPEDADGNIIMMPGLVPGISETSATPAAIAVAAGANNAFTLAAPAPTADVKIAASGTNLEGTTITASFEANALAAIYIADYTVQKIRVFDENGTPLTLPATAFSGLTNPMGLAYVPGTPGSIVVTETSNFQAPYMLSFDPAGNPQALAAGAFGGTSQPLFLTYGASDLFVPNYYNSTLSVFDATGDTEMPAATAFAKLQQPAGVAYDTNDADLYVTSTGNDTIGEYAPTTGSMLASAATGSHPMGVVFDSNDKMIYATFGGTDGNPLNAAGQEPVEGPEMAGVDEYSEGLTAVSNSTGFAVASTSSFFTGIAFDPYTKELYVSDSGMSKIDAFTEAGAAVTLTATAFSTISSSTSPPGDPMGILLVP